MPNIKNVGLLMKLYDAGTTVLIIIAVVAAIGVLSSKFLGDDNAVEEFSEEILELKTGVSVDLTPESQENANGNSKNLSRPKKSFTT
jgi:hypothetical protein